MLTPIISTGAPGVSAPLRRFWHTPLPISKYATECRYNISYVGIGKIVLDTHSGAAFAYWGAVFTWLKAQRAAFFILRGSLFVFDELRGDTCILGRRFHQAGISKRRNFRLEGAQLRLRNSGAAFASWGTVFRFRVFGWEAQRAAFLGLEGYRLWLWNSGAAFVSWGAVFIWLGAHRMAFFRFRGRPVVVAGLKDGIFYPGTPFSPGWELRRLRGRHFSY